MKIADRQFTDVREREGLKKYLSSPLGTLYFIPGPPTKILVRHFDSELPPTMVGAYVELIQAIHDWIEQRPELAALVQVVLPLEAGRDYVIRPFHVYITSLDSYTWDEPCAPEPPEELEVMRTALRAAMGQSSDPRDAIVERVLARSLLEPSGKTHESEHGFVIVEPMLKPVDVQDWAALQAGAPT